MIQIKSLIMMLVLSASLAATQRVSEVPAGTINGTNAVFTLSALPYTNSIKVFKNGMRLAVSGDFNINSQTITFVVAPSTGDSLVADYEAMIPSGYHMLVSKATNACAMPSSASKLLSASCAGTDQQKYNTTVFSGSFALLVKSSGQAVDLTSGSTTDGTQIITATYSGNRSQGWLPISLDNDTFFELANSLSNNNSCLTLSGASLVLQACAGLDTQKWQWQ